MITRDMNTNTFEVTLNVSDLTCDVWEAWCEQDSIENVEYLGTPSGIYEYWRVTADSLEAARAIVDAAIEGWDVEVVKIVASS